MEELNKKLAKWAGWKYQGTETYGWLPPNAKPKHNYYSLPGFTESLDACFKWLVPDHDIVSIEFEYSSEDVKCRVTLASGKQSQGLAPVGQDALALCKAIEKLIGEETSNA